MTVNEAKWLIKAELERRKLPYTKLTARTIDFTDLARASCVFVKVHGWVPNPQWTELKAIAVANGFRIES